MLHLAAVAAILAAAPAPAAGSYAEQQKELKAEADVLQTLTDIAFLATASRKTDDAATPPTSGQVDADTGADPRLSRPRALSMVYETLAALEYQQASAGGVGADAQVAGRRVSALSKKGALLIDPKTQKASRSYSHLSARVKAGSAGLTNVGRGTPPVANKKMAALQKSLDAVDAQLADPSTPPAAKAGLHAKAGKIYEDMAGAAALQASVAVVTQSVVDLDAPPADGTADAPDSGSDHPARKAAKIAGKVGGDDRLARLAEKVRSGKSALFVVPRSKVAVAKASQYRMNRVSKATALRSLYRQLAARDFRACLAEKLPVASARKAHLALAALAVSGERAGLDDTDLSEPDDDSDLSQACNACPAGTTAVGDDSYGLCYCSDGKPDFAKKAARVASSPKIARLQSYANIASKNLASHSLPAVAVKTAKAPVSADAEWRYQRGQIYARMAGLMTRAAFPATVRGKSGKAKLATLPTSAKLAKLAARIRAGSGPVRVSQRLPSGQVRTAMIPRGVALKRAYQMMAYADYRAALIAGLPPKQAMRAKASIVRVAAAGRGLKSRKSRKAGKKSARIADDEGDDDGGYSSGGDDGGGYSGGDDGGSYSDGGDDSALSGGDDSAYAGGDDSGSGASDVAASDDDDGDDASALADSGDADPAPADPGAWSAADDLSDSQENALSDGSSSGDAGSVADSGDGSGSATDSADAAAPGDQDSSSAQADLGDSQENALNDPLALTPMDDSGADDPGQAPAWADLSDSDENALNAGPSDSGDQTADQTADQNADQTADQGADMAQAPDSAQTDQSAEQPADQSAQMAAPGGGEQDTLGDYSDASCDDMGTHPQGARKAGRACTAVGQTNVCLVWGQDCTNGLIGIQTSPVAQPPIPPFVWNNAPGIDSLPDNTPRDVTRLPQDFPLSQWYPSDNYGRWKVFVNVTTGETVAVPANADAQANLQAQLRQHPRGRLIAGGVACPASQVVRSTKAGFVMCSVGRKSAKVAGMRKSSTPLDARLAKLGGAVHKVSSRLAAKKASRAQAARLLMARAQVYERIARAIPVGRKARKAGHVAKKASKVTAPPAAKKNAKVADDIAPDATQPSVSQPAQPTTPASPNAVPAPAAPTEEEQVKQGESEMNDLEKEMKQQIQQRAAPAPGSGN